MPFAANELFGWQLPDDSVAVDLKYQLLPAGTGLAAARWVLNEVPDGCI
jgi:hypothetical protein